MTKAKKWLISTELMSDRYWAPLLLLFSKQAKLQRYSAYIDLDGLTVDAQALMEIAKPWSPSERFMLYLALQLFNESNARDELNLSDMDRLDSNNKALAFQALQLRFAS